MSQLTDFLKNNDVISTKNLIDERAFKGIEKELQVKLGKQLKRYILTYGFLSYEYIELFGINSKQGLNSDMIKNTKYLHEKYPCTCPFVAIENAGDGDYILVDNNDNIYEFVPTLNNELKELNQKLFDYIYFRFQSVNSSSI